ncbi:RNA-binding CRS1 / YhbY (CRM) domain protein [Quillaja saponaria]|uniref:RNA-binding CRS1 / YhbY (CRM) domain protein n=1 Tax=Quillaja saponaria TaxID=32244 RepID=A0AAD7QBM0_QUISA|nr:RNA-binding CRS1 / YhbY (CRM) domain protein [Quillaja saponaria]
MAAAPSPSSHLLLNQFIRSQPPFLPSSSPTSSFISFPKPLIFSSTTTSCTLSKRLRHIQIPLRKALFNSLGTHPTPTPVLCHSFSSSSSLSFPQTPSLAKPIGSSSKEDGGNSYGETEQLGDEIDIESDDFDTGKTSGESTQMGLAPSVSPLKKHREAASNLPSLTVKEKKELASFAHSLGKKLKSQLVGKSGFTDNVATSFIETLEANELLKIKIHRTCPGELDDVVKRLEEATGSVVVGQIGRTVIIYRPSLTKLKAEEKKMQHRKVFLRRQSRFLGKEQAPGLSQRGRHGSQGKKPSMNTF